MSAHTSAIGGQAELLQTILIRRLRPIGDIGGSRDLQCKLILAPHFAALFTEGQQAVH